MRWDSSGLSVDLGVLPDQPQSFARGINAEGAIVGHSGEEVGIHVANRTATPVRWDSSGAMTVLDSLPGAPYTTADGINADGVIIGQSGTLSVPDGGLHAVRWDSAGAITDLGTLPNDLLSGASGIANDGTIVGRSYTKSTSHAVRWDSAGASTDLGGLPGATTSSAYGISSDGTTIIGASSDHAVKWVAAGSRH